MHKSAAVVLVVTFLFLAPGAASAAPPESAYVHVENSNGIGGACYLNSLGQLIMFRQPSLTTADTVARSGIATQIGFGRWAGGGIAAHPRGYTQGVELDLLRLTCTGFRVGYGRGGAYGTLLPRAAEGVTIFETEADAVLALKEQLAAGNPVQVHIDMYYTWAAVQAEYPSQDMGVPFHGSHSGVVNGYDADYVYMTDSGPTAVPAEDGEDIAVPWADFLAAWRETPNLHPNRGFWFGPYGMLYLTSDPVDISDEWVVAWAGLDATQRVGDLVTGPDSFRYAAEGMRKGRTAESVMSDFGGGVLYGARLKAAEFFTAAGYAEIAAKCEQSADLLIDIIIDSTRPDIPDEFDMIADLDEEAIALMQAVAAGVRPCIAVAPAGDNLSEPANDAFHFVYLPNVKSPSVEFAMTGDFSDRKRMRVLRPRNGNWYVALTPKDWRTLLAKDDGDRSLMWRVVGKGPDGSVASAEKKVTWDEQACVAVLPADSYAAGADELVRFEWTAPAVALKPVVVISATGDFGNKKTRVTLSPKRGESAATFAAGTAVQLMKKDDGDKTFHWRVEDAGAAKTTVTPSQTRTFTLP